MSPIPDSRRLDELERRVDRLERKQAALDAGFTFLKWVGPIAVGIAAAILGRF